MALFVLSLKIIIVKLAISLKTKQMARCGFQQFERRIERSILMFTSWNANKILLCIHIKLWISVINIFAGRTQFLSYLCCCSRYDGAGIHKYIKSVLNLQIDRTPILYLFRSEVNEIKKTCNVSTYWTT